MPKPAFIVEGDMEQRIVQNCVPSPKVVKIGTNGDKVAISALTKKIAFHFRVFNNKYYPVIVIIDRERRKETAEQIENEIELQLLSIGIDKRQFIIHVVDRCIESWISYHVAIKFGVEMPENQGQGFDSKGFVVRTLRKNGLLYHNTTAGVRLFFEMDIEYLSSICADFRIFRSKMINYCRFVRAVTD